MSDEAFGLLAAGDGWFGGGNAVTDSDQQCGCPVDPNGPFFAALNEVWLKQKLLRRPVDVGAGGKSFDSQRSF